MALIPQDPEILEDTIENNITFGTGMSPENIKRFTDIACFTEIIERKQDKLKTYIGGNGDLSTGERQRLALARALALSHDKEIFLMDESTSSLDSVTESRVFNNIFTEFPEKTIIASVHKSHLLYLFDIIYLFQDCKIIASGSLGDLIERSDEFNNLWRGYNTK